MNIVISGVNGQIGSQYANIFLSNGHSVFGIDINESSSIEGVNYHYFKLDISNEIEVDVFWNSIRDIDVLINNAGVGVFTPTLERSVNELLSVINVNLIGTILMSNAFIKTNCINSKNKKRIINVASLYGHISSDCRIYGDSKRNNSEIYSATKSGVIALTKYYACNFSDKVTVNSISPGGVLREQSNDFLLNYSSRSPQNRLASQEEIAKVMYFLVCDAPEHMNGEDIRVDGGFSQW